jgi:integrase
MATSNTERAWTATRALALAREPGTHKHPTVLGLFMRVSPKLKAVYGYRFKDTFNKEQSGTLGEVGALTTGTTLALDDAVNRYAAIREFHKSKNSPSGLTLKTAFTRWIVEHRKKGGAPLAESTLEYYREAYARYLTDYDDLPLSKITPEQWITILSAAQKRSVSQARGAYWMLHSLYAHFIELELIDKNPLAKQILRSKFAPVKKAVRKGHLRALNIKQFVAQLASIKGANTADALLILLLTGWRLSGVLRMRWGDIDLDAGTYTVHEHAHGWKGWAGVMPLSEYVVAILRERKAKHLSNEWVFPARHGKGTHATSVRGGLAKACEGLGYVITAHDLRRTFITLGEIVFGGNLHLVGRLAAHKHSDDARVQETAVTQGYVTENMRALHTSISTLDTVILELADMLPVDDETVRIFAARGVPFRDAEIELVDVANDDDDEGDTEE